MADDYLILAAGQITEQVDPGGSFRDEWRAKARPEQIPPPGRWRTWYLAGGRGCIAAETLVYLPLEDRHERVDVLAAAGQPVTVLAMTPQGPAPARTDGAPFAKGIAPLFELAAGDGATLLATARHRCLIPGGWVTVGAVLPGQLLAGGAPRLAGAAWPAPAIPVEYVRPAGTGVFYDMHVPGWGNYAAGGLWHHNSGKSWTGARTLAEWIMGDPEPGEWGIVAPTYPDAWSVCVEGESGILAAFGTTADEVKRGRSKLVEHWHRSFAEIRMRSGHVIRVASAQDGGLRIQGKNLKGAWCDEVGLWDNWDTTWNESLKYAVRKGESRIVATGTPKKARKARKLIRMLLADPKVRKARLRTADNAANLSEAFLDEVVGAAKGTRLEQQELEGILLDDVEGALWTAELIDSFRVDAAPDLLRVVVAVDPAVTSEEDSDETGIVVVGEADGGHGFVLADYSMRGTPDQVMKKVVWAYNFHQADRVVGEVNNGGDYIGAALHAVDPNVPYRSVVATRGKRVRAEPVSVLYDQGRMHHVGVHIMLEEQMVSWVPSDPGESPDRVDGLVWACAELSGLSAGSWLQAYGVKRCEECSKAYPEREGDCPACHPRAIGAGEPAAAAPAAGLAPETVTGWASAYGDFVRCRQCSRAYDRRHYEKCPHCAQGSLDFMHRAGGHPAGGLPRMPAMNGGLPAGLRMPGR